MDLITSNTVEPQAIKPTNFWGYTWKRVKRDRNALLGIIMLSIIISSIVFLPLVYTTPGDKIDFTISTMPPSWQHPFGTNDLGQDQLARLLQGGRVSLTVGISAMVVAIFLGLGFPPDIPTWGRMLFEAKDYIASAPYMALFPGLAIFLTVLSINYIGDGLTSNS